MSVDSVLPAGVISKSIMKKGSILMPAGPIQQVLGRVVRECNINPLSH